VDRFKDDVHTRPGSKEPSGEAPPFGDDNTVCTDNWTTANAVSEGTVKVFDQTGIFICACRHGIIETVIEMLRSGELYVTLLFHFVHILIIKTGPSMVLQPSTKSSTSLATIKAWPMTSVVPIQQLSAPVPLVIKHGFTAFFSSSTLSMATPITGLANSKTTQCICLASGLKILRHANGSSRHPIQLLPLSVMLPISTGYNFSTFILINGTRISTLNSVSLSSPKSHTVIDPLFQGKFLYNNYVQALSIIKEYSKEIDNFKTTRGFSNEDFENWRTEELDYLMTVAAKLEYDVHVVAYVEALEALAKAQ
jgi:Kyakuja-Dileera-Zisupton transposase